MRNFAARFFSKVLSVAYRHAQAAKATSTAAALSLPDGPDGPLLAGCSVECRAGSAAGRVRFGRNSVLSCRIVLERGIGTVSVGDDSYIGGSQIICASSIEIGNNVLISWGCTIVDHDSHSLNWRDRAEDVRKWRDGLVTGGLDKASELKNWDVVEMAGIRIQDKVWLGMNVTILKGVTIGEGAIVAAGSIVTKDVAPWTLVAGNPARVIKELIQE